MKNNKTDCLNCGQTLSDSFCPVCGQGDIDINLTFSELVQDFFGDMFTYDSRFYRTIVPLLFRPGFLTHEFFKGRRIPYVPPMRLYLFISFLLFLWLALVDTEMVNIGNTDNLSDAFSEEIASANENETQTRIIELRKKIEPNIEAFSQNPNAFIDLLSSRLPYLMFLLLPFFALIMWLHFAFSRFNYLQHFVFTLHIHAFTYLLSLLFSISNKIYPWNYGGIAMFLLVIYITLANRQAFGSSWMGGIFKTLSILSLYFMVLVFAFSVFLVVNFINYG